MYYIFDDQNREVDSVETKQEAAGYKSHDNYSFVEAENSQFPLPWTYQNPAQAAKDGGVKSYGACSEL